MRILLSLLATCLLYIPILAQPFFNVAAPSGLFLRNAPTLNASKLGKIPVGTFLEVIERTGKTFSVEDDGETIEGQWVKIRHKDFPAGYVFDGYLLPLQSDPGAHFDCDSELPCHTTIPFKEVDLTIYNYQAEGLERKAEDTLFIYEYVFNSIFDRLLYLKPKEPVRSVQLFFTVHETITHQRNPADPDALLARWAGFEPFVEIKGERNFFRIPGYVNPEEARQQKMGLRDTLVDRSGESWNVATLIYEGKPSLYLIDEVWLKVLVTHLDGRQTAEILRVELSYGC